MIELAYRSRIEVLTDCFRTHSRGQIELVLRREAQYIESLRLRMGHSLQQPASARNMQALLRTADYRPLIMLSVVPLVETGPAFSECA
jgi:hypothetical protein